MSVRSVHTERRVASACPGVRYAHREVGQLQPCRVMNIVSLEQDHMYLYLAIPPYSRVSEAVKILKDVTSRRLRERFRIISTR